MRLTIMAVLGLLTLAAAPEQEKRSLAAPGRDPVAVVSHIKVLSDKVDDVSSLEAWKKSFIKDGMTDEQKALAIWKSVVMFQHQESPPSEFFQQSVQVQDAIKLFNVYGYAMCSNASAHVEQLARFLGFQARGWAINGHSVPEVFWDGAWHLLDSSLINYFPKSDGKIASVEEITAAVTDWYAKNPGYKGDDKKLRQFHAADGWTGWKKGPELLARAPTFDAGGWWPAKTHGWYATMQEYDGSAGNQKAFFYEYGYSQGYQVNIQLRPGERLTRNWSNKGLHVNMKGGGGTPGCLTTPVGKDNLVYTPKYGDLAPGRIGNGVHEYDVPPALLQAGTKAGSFTVRMPSSYIYLTGKLAFRATGDVAVSFSDNHGLDWKEIGRGSGTQEVDLTPHVYRRYDYRVRFDLKGAGASLTSLKLSHDVQHSQRALPALAQGSNTITFSTGPAEGTITLEGATDPNVKGKQLTYLDFHPQVTGLKDPNLIVDGGKGEITFPVSTPGDLVRLRFGTHYRARDAKDGWDYQVSFDAGKTWKTVERASGPFAGHCKYVTVSNAPPGTREALVRFSGTSRNTTLIMDFRIDADYLEPVGGFRPVKVTYRWDEEGQAKEHVHVARRPQETYAVSCAARPTMKSIVLELAE